MRLAQNLLALYAMHSEYGEMPIPSLFSKDDFVMGAFDNANYADNSFLSGSDSLYYTASFLFQGLSSIPLESPLCPILA